MFVSKKYKNSSDQDLLHNLNKGDEKAFKEVYDRYWQKMLTLAIYKTSSKEQGADCVQDIFIKLWEKRGNLAIDNLENYLFGALKYQIINKLRVILKDKIWADITEIDPEVEFQDLLTVQDLEQLVAETLNSLPTKTREIFEQSRYQNLTNADISKLHEMSIKSVEYHITKALKVFKEQLKDFLPFLIIGLIQ
jgi:RNA polymerase sigma-70 factor (family 1)